MARASRALRSRRRRRSRSRIAAATTVRSTVGGAAGASPWACTPLELPISGRVAPLTVVNEYAALVAGGVDPTIADSLMVGARHGIWARRGTDGEEHPGVRLGCTRQADAEFYSLDTGPWTGGNVWESGEVLARVFSAPNGWWPHRLSGAKAIDLGCGTGVVGLAAALQGACVTLTDRVLACAEHNRNANFATHERWRCQLSRLSWGDVAGAERLCSLHGPFDFVFTADTLYNGEDQEALAATVDTLSEGTHTQVIVATPNTGDVFFPVAQVRHGFQIADISDDPEVAAAVQATVDSDKQAGARHSSRRRVKVYSMQRH